MAASCWSTTATRWSGTTQRDDACGLAIQRQTALFVLTLTLTACSRIDPGISREKAEAVLKVYDYLRSWTSKNCARWQRTTSVWLLW